MGSFVESDANLDLLESSSLVPGVTHLQTGLIRKPPRRVDPVGKPSSSTAPTNPKKKGSMKPVKDRPQGATDHGEPQAGQRDVTLKNLRPEDKKRVANLIKELAKAGEEREEVRGQLATERVHFKTKFVNLETQMKTLQSERELLQQQYLQCQTLLAQSQERLSKEQTEHTESSRKVQPERDSSNVKSPERTRADTPQHQWGGLSPSKGSRQFQPAFQSTTKPGYDHQAKEDGMTAVSHGQGYPDNLPTGQQAVNHGRNGSTKQSTSTRGQPTHFTQTDHTTHPMYAVTAHDPRNGLSNPSSPTLFSADEFHPLPEELCSTSLGILDSADDRGAMEPAKGVDSGRQRPQERGEGRQQHTNRERTGPSLHDRNAPHRHPTNNHQLRAGSHPQTNQRHEQSSHPGFPDRNQKIGSQWHVSPRANGTHPHRKGMITPEQLSQSSGRVSPSETWGNLPRRQQQQSRMATPDMLVERKKRLEGQKAQLKREQEWLRKELRNQEELLHQKQLELEAHRQSLLDSPHPRGPGEGWGDRPRFRRSGNGPTGDQEHRDSSLPDKTSGVDGNQVLYGQNQVGQSRRNMGGSTNGGFQSGSRRLGNSLAGGQEVLLTGNEYPGRHEQPSHHRISDVNEYPVPSGHRGHAGGSSRRGSSSEEPWRNSGDAEMNGHQGQIIYRSSETNDQGVNGGGTMDASRQSLRHGPPHGFQIVEHPSERTEPGQVNTSRVHGNATLTPHEQYPLGSGGQAVSGRVLQSDSQQLLSKHSASGRPMGRGELRLEGRNGTYYYQGGQPELDHRRAGRDVSAAVHSDIQVETGQFMVSDDDVQKSRIPRNGTGEDGMYRGRELIQGSVALHSKSVTRGKPTNPTMNQRVDVSASRIVPPPQPLRMGTSPALHPSSALTREAWASDTSSDEHSEENPRECHGRGLSGSKSKEEDLHLLHDLIEGLNSLPSVEGSETSQPLSFQAPTARPYQRRVPSRYHSTVNGTGLLSARSEGRNTMMDDSGLTRIVASEIVDSSDGEEESRILGDIFFLN